MSFKIYTKTGDQGETGLFGGKRVSKSDIRIDSYGTVDELNSHLGLLIATLQQLPEQEQTKAQADLTLLSATQSTLFTIGSQLATPEDQKLFIEPISKAEIELLEHAIDRLDQSLPALKSFVLPGGSIAIAQCHVCRTVTRRAERRVVELKHHAHVDSNLIQYLNRLSDYFFTLSRAICLWQSLPEIPWVSKAD